MSQTWKEKLHAKMRPEWAREIDIFETEIALRKQGKIEEKLFAETRLRRGAYGQRYDNGQRHDGFKTQQINFPSGELTKGPNTLWDAPGMHRIKIPMGILSAEQLDVLSEVAEEYSDAILHVTTRQDIQLHFVHIDDTPDLMRRLAAVDITTREACGNSVRNVTACPYSGVCHDELFDVTPYAYACTFFLLGHPDTQDFGRKFKIAFSGCKHHPCALTSIHDLGAIAAVREINGVRKRGFEIYVGGGLGAVPYQAKLLDEFVPEEELLPLSQAICRVFARLGEKKNRARARVKFLVAKIGIEEFKRLVDEERTKLPPDPRWTEFLADLRNTDDKPIKKGEPLPEGAYPEDFKRWRKTNVRTQSQPNYGVVTVKLALGDMTSQQGRALANLARKYTGDTMRTTVEQNLVYRWVSERDLPEFYQALKALGLHETGAETISDITACPGTDTCKLGISSSRGLAAELREHFEKRTLPLAPQVEKLHLKTSGCFNSCGQHHVADIGFLGVSRNVNGRRVPHFQLVVGGQWTENAANVGLAIGAVPSKRVPEVLDRVTAHFVEQAHEGESFQAYIQRIGKAKIRESIKDLLETPSYEKDPSFYSDWGDPREYTIGDMGVGECAGEVVPLAQFGLTASEREVFEAQLLLDKGELESAAQTAYHAMLQAAKTLTRIQDINISDDPNQIMEEFKKRFHETKIFHDPFAGDRFVQFLIKAHEEKLERPNQESVRQRVDEAQLFIDAAHACYARISETSAPVVAPAPQENPA